MGELTTRVLVAVDWEAGLVFIPAAADAGAPANPNQIQGWGPYWALVPACPLQRSVWNKLAALVADRAAEADRRQRDPSKPQAGPDFLARFAEACPEPGGNGSPNGSPNHSPNGSSVVPVTVPITVGGTGEERIRIRRGGGEEEEWEVRRGADANGVRAAGPIDEISTRFPLSAELHRSDPNLWHQHVEVVSLGKRLTPVASHAAVEERLRARKVGAAS
jgi:hypothetical protein